MLAQHPRPTATKSGGATDAFNKAQTFFKARKFEEAAGHYETFLRRYPNDPRLDEALFYLGVSHLGLQDRSRHDRGIRALELLLLKFPQLSKAPGSIETMANYYETSSNRAKAVELRKKLERDYPREMQGAKPSLVTYDHLNEAKRAISKKDYPAARHSLQQFLLNSQLDIRAAEARLLYANTLERVGQNSQALDAYEGVKRLHANSPEALRARFAIIHIHSKERRHEHAVRSLKELHAIAPKSQEAAGVAWDLALLLLLEHDLSNAQWCFTLVAQETDNLLRQAASREVLMNWDAAGASASVESDSVAAATLLRAADRLAAYEGDSFEAEKIYSMIFNRWPKYRPDLIQFKRAVNQLIADEPESIQSAKLLFQNLVGTHPESPFAPEALVRLCILHTGHLNDPNSGIKYIKQLLDQYPRSDQMPTGMFHLATLYQWTKRKAEAAVVYERICNEYPQSAQAALSRVRIERLRKTSREQQ